MCIIINMHVHTVYAQGTFYARPRVTPAGLRTYLYMCRLEIYKRAWDSVRWSQDDFLVIL